MQFYMHVNYLENTGLPLEQTLPWCARAGYDGVELRDRDLSGRLPLDEYLHQAYAAATAAGLQVVFSCRNDCTNPDAKVRDQALAHFAQVIEFAGKRGVRLLNAMAGPVRPAGVPPVQFEKLGSNAAQPEHWQRSTEFLREAADIAAAHGLTICLETHCGFLHDLGPSTRRLLDEVARDNVQANFDYGNIHLHADNQGMAKEVSLLAGRIGYVHLKNLVSFRLLGSPLFFCTPLNQGDLNNFALLRLLLQSGYRGPLTIENTMQGDKLPWMADDLKYLQSTLHAAQASLSPGEAAVCSAG